ncbi:hypothetical protein SAY87_028294 [Trapa incisa]|uniref:Uncharacterized protein n=1 Tax=Trapa incisa TaxID=236973 RepID=A0AAN7L174_9MYRT|nr:hypothetical protein SAY87_028294 [Trapa incisa]
MSGRHKFLVFYLLVAFFMLSEFKAEALRLPRGFWEQMQPKTFPRPSSSPSRGTNAISSYSIDPMKYDKNLRVADGKVPCCGTKKCIGNAF